MASRPPEYTWLTMTDSRPLRHTSVIGSLPDSLLVMQVLAYSPLKIMVPVILEWLSDQI